MREQRLNEIESFMHGSPGSEALRSYVTELTHGVRRLREALKGVAEREMNDEGDLGALCWCPPDGAGVCQMLDKCLKAGAALRDAE